MKKILSVLVALTLVITAAAGLNVTASAAATGTKKAATTKAPVKKATPTKAPVKKVAATKAPVKSTKLEIVDLKGRKVVFDKLPQRIVSLSPANTEIVFALGAGAKLVGVTSFCDYPEEATKKPKIGTFEGPNLELIKAAKPDVVIAGGYIQEDLIKKLEDLKIPVISTEAADFNSIYDSIKLIGKLTGTDSKADAINKSLKDTVAAIKAKTNDGSKPRVFYLVWADTLTTAGSGTFIDGAIQAAGGINVASKIKNWGKYSAEQLIADNPDIFICAKYSTAEGVTLKTITDHPVFGKLKCVQNGKVYIMKDDNTISRPGPRIIEAIKELDAVFNKK